MAAYKESNDKARIVGINHVALEVGSIEEALAFYGALFDVSLRGRSDKMAFIDIGDQFIDLTESHSQRHDEDRHLAWWWTTKRRCVNVSSRPARKSFRDAG
jgi:catechol 2,3-dioxygenase-like lactoylglutathione lyase family enzyme